MSYISANNEHIPSKITPVMQGNMVNAYKSNDLEMLRSMSITSTPVKIGSRRYIWLVAKYSLKKYLSGMLTAL